MQDKTVNRFKKSPFDFLYRKKKTLFKKCDYPGCKKHGEYRAPKDRDHIHDYFFFCLDHVTSYNKSWNYYDGMSDAEIELDRRQDTYGARPTWDYTKHKNIDRDELLKHIFENFGSHDDTYRQRRMKEETPELKALLDLGLEPSATFKEIKIRYRKLVKQYHPDVNKSNAELEEKIKKINAAYTVLKKVYQ